MSATDQSPHFLPPVTSVKPGSPKAELPDGSLAGDESNMNDNISAEEQTYTEMAPPPKTPVNQQSKRSLNQNINVQTTQAPTSSQRPISLRQGKQTGENESCDESTEEEGEGEGEEQDIPAGHELPDFDWTQLETDYRNAMKAANEKEQGLLQEFEGLVNYFAAWAQVSQNIDQHRAEKRYKTREAHIRHSELEFAKKKEHYMKVVAAFQQALQLLNLS